MPACGNWWWKWGGGLMIFVQWWQISTCKWYAGTTEHPFSGSGMGGHWEAPTGHVIPSNHTKHHCLIWKGLWPCHSMGTSLPSLLLNSRGGSPQIYVAGGWKCGLGICLHLAEWGPIPCTLIQQGACQYNDIWHPLWGSLQSPPPAAGMQTIRAQGSGGVPRRFEWWDGCLTVHLPGASPLGCCCLCWTYPQTTADRSGPQWHAVWEHNNCHSDSLIYTNPTPPSSRHCRAFWWHHCSNQPAAHGHHEATAAGFPYCLIICLPAQPASAALGPLPAAGESEDPLRPEGMDSHPCPDGNPHTDISMGGHSSWHPQLFPNHFSTALLKTPQMTGIPFVTQPQAPSKGGPASLLDELLQLQEKMNVALERLLTSRATIDFCHRKLELNAELVAHLNDAQAAEAIKEVEVHNATTACDVWQAHRDSVLVLECKQRQRRSGIA